MPMSFKFLPGGLVAVGLQRQGTSCIVDAQTSRFAKRGT